MNNPRSIKCLLLAILWVLLSVVLARALDPIQPASSLLRTHFTTDNGLPAAVVNQTQQTKDGFLWLIVNGNNLIRFDGKNFYHFHNPRPSILAASPDGDLWAATAEGLIRIPAATLNQFTLNGLVSYSLVPGKASEIFCLRFSRSGVLWVGTAAGLFRYEQGRFVAVGPPVATRQIVETPNGSLLLITERGIVELTGSELVPHPPVTAQLGVKDDEIYDVLKDRQGNTWYCTFNGVARETNGRIEKLGTYVRPGHRAFSVHEDTQGTIWIGKEEGLFRATPKGLELVARGMEVRSLSSDRDGNLWVSTNGDGLYKIKEPAVRMFTAEHGLPKGVLKTVLAARDGTIWTGANCGGITHFDGRRFRTYSEKDGLLNSCVLALAEDVNRDLWIGTYGGAFHFHNGSFTQYTKSHGFLDERVRSIVAARDGTVWFATGNGLTRLQNGQFRTFTTADGLSANSISRVFEDRAGNIWIGTRQGLDRVAGDRFENFASVPKALVIPFGEDRDGGLFFQFEAGSEAVTHRLYKDRSDTIKQLTACDMIETDEGEVWLGGDGLGRVQPGNFTHARSRDEPLDYEGFSTADGLITGEASGPGRCLALTPDRKIYAATPKGLAVFDLARLQVTNEKPSIYLTDVTIGRNTERASGREIVLSPGTNHVEIHFAAVEISAPEKIRLQYRLDGVDSEWLDAPANPNAIYSYIPVGTHALHIRACNRNGIWDREGVVFSITQQPYFYQTRWFVAAMIALGVLLVVFIYRLRVARISRMLSARFDERLAERTRVARELHDTLLQTVQGSRMVADHALKNSGDHARMVRAMEQLSTWLAQATEEGRAALLSLRASTTERNDLAEAFRRAIDECGGSTANASFSVNGSSIEMHPVVRDEIYRIGYEAIRNACAHSGADRLEVRLEYAQDLTLRVSDNGVGIDSEVVEKGKEGHFGLNGMKERAERIAAKFNLVTSPESGTSITLVVPGRIVFRGTRPNWKMRLKSHFQSSD